MIKWNQTFVGRPGCCLFIVLFLCELLISPAPGAVATNNLPSIKPSRAYVGSVKCRDCHEHFYQLWSDSIHGLAMQPFTAKLAQSQLTPQRDDIVAGTNRYRFDLASGSVIERTGTNQVHYAITQTLGGKNVFYFLTPLDRGRLQVLPVAYDVRRHEWFDTTASAIRHFGDGTDTALYWKERPLTFNTSCYSCHVSQLVRNYDAASDSYHTTWAEPGINCETCHGPSAGHVRLFRDRSTNQPPPADVKLIVPRQLSIAQRNAMCAPCHAKMSPLTASFTPGQRFFDHYDLITLEDRDFYSDGRDLGENYTYTQWRQSPCAQSGQLDCVHCHTSSGRYRFKDVTKANDACLPCHADRVKNASAHTHHPAGSPGNECISCHMPMTEFARMRRTDHSMRPPTPATTLVYHSPNACNLCHTNQTAAWANKLVREWHPDDYQKPVLERAALIAAARQGNWNKLPDILAYLSNSNRDEVETVSLVRLLAGCSADEKWPVLRNLMNDASPLVRASVASELGARLDLPNAQVLLRAVKDSYRLVRVRAAAALAPTPVDRLPADQHTAVKAATAELLQSMKARPDQMGSHYNLGNLYMAQGEAAAAVNEFTTASRLQPEALPPYVNAAMAYNVLGKNDQAEACLRRALQLDPTNAAVNLNLGMLLAEMGKMPGAEAAFRAAFKADPHSARAAYNLGILLAKEHPKESLNWSRRAAELAPEEPKYGYTYAFYLHQAGRLDEAIKVIRDVRQRFPDDRDSAMFQQMLLQEQRSGVKK